MSYKKLIDKAISAYDKSDKENLYNDVTKSISDKEINTLKTAKSHLESDINLFDKFSMLISIISLSIAILDSFILSSIAIIVVIVAFFLIMRMYKKHRFILFIIEERIKTLEKEHS